LCGVVGIYSDTQVDIKHFLEILNQSMIRGRHATGVAWNDNGHIKQKIIPKSANYMQLEDIKTNMIIGHARYSTSDLRYNQPLYTSDVAIVHNGVITQENPKNWLQKYGYHCDTKNDSELVLRCWHSNKQPLSEYVFSSMAVALIDLRKEHKMAFFRNEQRPLWYSKSNGNTYVASTKNILARSKINGDYIKTQPCYLYTITEKGLEQEEIRKAGKDLQ
jgi:glutamine phosphoribosylpyrophosphate amidotransferase